MGDLTREYLELLSEKYPNEPAVCSELIKLRSVLSLPKGTEHFISDLHGEYAAVRHILEKVRRLFGDTLGEERCHALCSVIYYPPEALNALRERGELTDERLRETLESLRTLAETLSSKYTRGYVRRRMPEEWAFVLDELLHLQRDEDANQLRYHDALVSSVIASGAAEQVIAALAALIKRLAVERHLRPRQRAGAHRGAADGARRAGHPVGQPRHPLAGRGGGLARLYLHRAAHHP